MAEHGKIPPGKCANCHAPLRGPYCFVCGQRVVTHIHSFWEFVQEAAEGITHADSRVWRTVWPLLFKPGFLTVEYFAGRRARYLPPFRLYLVLSVLFFLVAASLPDSSTGDLGGLNVQMSLGDDPADPQETPQQRADRFCKDISYQGPWQDVLSKRFTLSCHKIVLDNAHDMLQGLLHNVPRALFILLPLLALVMRLMYLRRHYVEHLMFFIHLHSFLFLLLLLFLPLEAGFAETWVEDILVLFVLIYVPWYVFRAMRRAYGQGWWVTFVKFSTLSLAYVACAVLMLILTAFYTIVTL